MGKITMACTSSWGACWVRNGLIILMLNKVMWQQGGQGHMIRNVRSVMTGLVGQENQELNFTKAKLEAVLLHQCTCVHVTVWDLIWVWGFKQHVQLGVVCIALVWKFIQAEEPGPIYSKEQRLEHWSLGDPGGELVRGRKLALPRHPEWTPRKVRVKPGQCPVSDT